MSKNLRGDFFDSQCTWMQISRKPLGIDARFQRSTNRKWHRESNGHVIESQDGGLAEVALSASFQSWTL